ncbi:MAG: bifunctional DNA primase/polymerase [Anaerolineae bacterium]|nr:bifunctional DNA primase/polymerase [Anaerolineae bacterium]
MLHVGGTSIFDIANNYARRLECEAFPVVGKAPALGHEWRQNALGRPGTHQATYDAWNAATGYALTPIPGSTLAIIDIDDPTFAPKLLEKFPALRTALTVSRDNHRHIYVRLEKPLPKATAQIKSPAGDEIASLRGAGAYVVGPYSQHPTGAVYKPANSSPAKLDVLATAALLFLFGLEDLPSAERIGGAGVQRQIVAPAKQTAAPPKLLKLLLNHFEEAGYHQRYDAERDLWWLNGQCPNHKNHPEGDRHPSFGFNNQGMAHCFKCGWMKAIDLAPMLGIYPIHYRDAATPTRYAVKREQRAELIAKGFTRAVRLHDLLTVGKSKDRYRWTLRDLIAVGQRVEWSTATTCRNIRQAVEAGLLVRLSPGTYARRSEFADPAPGRPYGERYSKHPVEYRRAICLRAEQRVQPERATAYNPSAARIAYLTGVSERTLYRYEDTLGIQRLQVWERTPVAPDFSSPAHYYGYGVLPGERRQAYARYEVMTRSGVVRRFADNDYSAAAECAQEQGGIVLHSSRLPSIRVLPGQKWEDRFPAGCKLSDDFGRVYVDVPYLPRLLANLAPSALPHHGMSAEALPTLERGLRKRPALINDTDPTDKHDKQSDQVVVDEVNAERLRRMHRRATKSRNPFRQLLT